MATRKPRNPTKFQPTGEGIPPTLPKAPVIDVRVNIAPRLVQGLDGNGIRFATLKFSGSTNANVPFDMDVSFLLSCPNLLEPFVFSAVALLGPKPVLATAQGWRRELMGGFVPFLGAESLTEIHVGDISAEVINAFTKWLNQVTQETGGARWDSRTRSKRWRALRAVLHKLRESPTWRDSLHPTSDVRLHPWRSGVKNGALSSSAKNKTTELTQEHMTALRLAAIKAVQRTMNDFADAEELVASGRIGLKPIDNLRRGDGLTMSFANLLAYIDAYFSEGNFSFDGMPTKLRSVIRAHHFKLVELRVLFHPTAQAIVPFVLLMTIAFFYNPTTIRDAQLSDFEYENILNNALHFLGDDGDQEDEDGDSFSSADVLKVNALKRRAHRRQPVSIPVDDAPDNPAVLLEFLKRWTKGIRNFAPTYWADALFLFIAVVGDAAVKGFHGVKLHTDAYTWHYNLDAFCDEYGVEKFTLNDLRTTLVNMTLTEFEGNPLIAKVQANHKNLNTTMSYRRHRTILTYFEKLAHVMQLRTRHRENIKTLDPRGRSSELDPECVTPGWACLDIYDSPYTAKGKYCSAYGYCPKCPFGSLDLTSPVSYAYAINLLDAVNRAQQTLPPAEWLERLGPVQDNLIKKWLPSFPLEVQEAALKIEIPLMPTPE